MNQEFIDHALQSGQQGQQWHDNIPQLIKNVKPKATSSPATIRSQL